jgi:geranylgeranyl diphosphate synthase type II
MMKDRHKETDLPFELGSYLQEKQRRIDAELRRVLHRSAEGAPPSLLEAMEYSLLAPGKKLRPILVLMGCQASGGSEAAALPAACAVEMVHTYSLIHDDLPAMDDDDLRRGLPTCHKKFGEALAILAGDALLTLAFQVLAESCPPSVAAVSCLELASGAGAAGMVGGQVLDLAAEEAEGVRNVRELETIHRRKTGALFRASLRMGYHAAVGENAGLQAPATLDALDRYARAFGLCFQVTDDLLDVTGHVDRTGKRVGKDAQRGKLTYPSLLGVEESRKRARELYEEAVESVRNIGPNAQPLTELARYVIERDR